MQFAMTPLFFAQLVPEHAEDVLLGGAILLAIVVAVFVALVVLLKKMDPRRRIAPSNGLGPGLSLDELERLHDAGSITDEEYRIMRQIVIGKEYARVTRSPAAAGRAEDDQAESVNAPTSEPPQAADDEQDDRPD
jgi:hypothetical protein